MTEGTCKAESLCGLDNEGVEESRRQYGCNSLTPPKRESLWRQYIDKYKDPIIQILLVAAAVSLVLAFIENDFVETIGIFVAIFLATTIGFVFEVDAARKFDVLTALGEEQPVKVRRNGHVVEIPRKDVVVGDIVLIETGDEIPADGMLLQARNLQVDESSLTGEPIAEKRVMEEGLKGSENLGFSDNSEPSSAESAYPVDKVLRSTMVMSGSATYRVTAVGDNTEIGKVARSSSEQTAVKTPLAMQLDRLAKIISKFGFGLSVAAAVIFLVHDIIVDPLWHTTDYFRMAEVVLQYFMMAVTLIVMAVPEGLPMAITLALALNMRRMLKSKNLVRKLHACETMGAVTVICTDKTGTLTENRMQVADVMRLDGDEDMLRTAFALNSTAHLDAGYIDDGEFPGFRYCRGIGNPTEVALLLWIEEKEINGFSMQNDNLLYNRIRQSAEIPYQLPFTTERKYMATVATIQGKTYLLAKGAPEIIMAGCHIPAEQKTAAEHKLQDWQQKAMRTLAFAYKELADDVSPDDMERETQSLDDMTLQAVVAISDPIRKDVPAAVAECRKAGIEVKIVTGDTSATAKEIARQIGIWNDKTDDKDIITGADFAALSDDEARQRAETLKVMCRARPADKQRLVNMLQNSGQIVAVTGDGTNDAPALNHAHVGLSLGSSTNVAKEASDMTLLDDSFGSIVNAVMWGRSLYKNIQRFLYFQLTVNVAALLLVLAGSVIGTEMPLTITQILWVNLIMDTFAAMALASLPPTKEVMNDKPRSNRDFIITKPMLWGILGMGVMMFIALFVYLLYCLQGDGDVKLHELTMFFTTFVMLQFWNMLNAKALGSGKSAFCGITNDKGLLFVMLMIFGGQWLIVTYGGMMFRCVPLSLKEWFMIIVATSAVLWVGELWRLCSSKNSEPSDFSENFENSEHSEPSYNS